MSGNVVQGRTRVTYNDGDARNAPSQQSTTSSLRSTAGNQCAAVAVGLVMFMLAFPVLVLNEGKTFGFSDDSLMPCR